MLNQSSGKPPGIFKSILFLIPVFVAGSYLANSQHPSISQFIFLGLVYLRRNSSPYTSFCSGHLCIKAPQISEERVRNFTRHLLEDIGYCTICSSKHAAADKWMGHGTGGNRGCT
ncbi:hypothetical protein DL96DRAFT_1625145, partial [Flagelloscypha sp. PMI_526]